MDLDIVAERFIAAVQVWNMGHSVFIKVEHTNQNLEDHQYIVKDVEPSALESIEDMLLNRGFILDNEYLPSASPYLVDYYWHPEFKSKLHEIVRRKVERL